MNTRQGYARLRRPPPAAVALSVAAAQPAVPAVAAAAPARMALAALRTAEQKACEPDAPATWRHATRRHAAADSNTEAALTRAAQALERRFGAIEPLLRELAPLAAGDDFAARAERLAAERLGVGLAPALWRDAWQGGHALGSLYAALVWACADAATAQAQPDTAAIDATRSLLHGCRCHHVQVAAGGDARLASLLTEALRLPPSDIVQRRNAAESTQDALQAWTAAELQHQRRAAAGTAGAGWRMLRLGVYAFSCLRPLGLHALPERDAAQAALLALEDVREAVRSVYGGALDIVLLGIDTDRDALRVHVPDSLGGLSLYRSVDAAELVQHNRGLDAAAVQAAVVQALQQAPQAHGAWSAGEGAPREDMLRLLAALLQANLAQIDRVAERHGGCYPELHEAPRLAVVGEPIEPLALRNLAATVPLQGMAETASAVERLAGVHAGGALPLPVAVHQRYDTRIPGDRERAGARVQRLQQALAARLSTLSNSPRLAWRASVQALGSGRIEPWPATGAGA